MRIYTRKFMLSEVIHHTVNGLSVLAVSSIQIGSVVAQIKDYHGINYQIRGIREGMGFVRR